MWCNHRAISPRGSRNTLRIPKARALSPRGTCRNESLALGAPFDTGRGVASYHPAYVVETPCTEPPSPERTKAADFGVCGENCGERGGDQCRNRVFPGQLERVTAVKLDFQQAVMIVKHNHKDMFCWAFRSLNIEAIPVQTTGSPSNHCVCGEARGEQKEGSNG
jgi:hypothetical protein